MELSTTMRTVMQKNKLRAADLARLADIPYPMLSRILSNDVVDPTLSVLKKISRTLGITLSQLVGEEALPQAE